MTDLGKNEVGRCDNCTGVYCERIDVCEGGCLYEASGQGWSVWGGMIPSSWYFL